MTSIKNANLNLQYQIENKYWIFEAEIRYSRHKRPINKRYTNICKGHNIQD